MQRRLSASLLRRARTLALALTSLAASSTASAQVVVQSSTTTTAEVVVSGRVTTTTTETVLIPNAVIVEPASVMHEPPRLAPLLTLRGELALSGAHDSALAGASATLGLDADSGWGAGLVTGYFGEIDTNAPSEVLLALEGSRDFSPADSVGFVLVARAGTALVLDAHGPSARPLAQLGIGARVSLDPRIAFLVDVRGELQLRPSSLDIPSPSVFGGFVMTTGLALRLD